MFKVNTLYTICPTSHAPGPPLMTICVSSMLSSMNCSDEIRVTQCMVPGRNSDEPSRYQPAISSGRSYSVLCIDPIGAY
eukprot:scaffold13560_cov161-Cylindrotheca_fusiformis.AAC.8